MIFRFALRNMLRLLWRTALYFFIVFFVVVSVVASLLIRRACLNAKTTLEEDYVFVASLVPKKKNGLVLSDLSYCLTDTDVFAYNVTMSEGEGCIPLGENMTKLPSKESKEDPEALLFDGRGCAVSAVENLSLESSFFLGKCRIRNGTGFSAEGYSGGAAEIVIPWWLADRYGLSVGDAVVRHYSAARFVGEREHLFLNCEIVGIYECTETVENEMQYPAYIPLAIGERDYKKLPTTLDTALNIDRADFLLGGREDFENFVKSAERNGLDFKNAELVFNNSVYDSLSVELDNIHTIALAVAWIVLGVGICVLVFFTVYLYHSREKERTLLTCLGMPKYKINGMIALEHIVVFVLATAIGTFAGFGVANGICDFVSESVLEKASASEAILSDETVFESTKPLDYPVKIEISPSKVSYEGMDMEINLRQTVGEGEIGISSLTYYEIGDEVTDIFTSAFSPVRVVGLSDIDLAGTSVRADEISSIPNYYGGFVYGFVSKDSPYADEIEKNGKQVLFVAAEAKDSYVLMSGATLDETTMIASEMIVLIGTYEENTYCSDGDILISLEGYHRLYSAFSVAEGSFCFERIGAVYKKEES